MRWIAGVLALLFFAAIPASAVGIDAQYPLVHQFFPKATSFGPITGNPPAANVYAGNKVIGYVFESRMVAPVPAYSGEPVNILIAIDGSGQIIGTKVLEQHEPILLVGIPVQKLYDFVARYIGHRVTDNIVVGNSGGGNAIHIDAISSATVTSMAVNQTIMDAAVKVAVSRKIVSAAKVEGVGESKLRTNYFENADWVDLTGNGAIRRLHLTRDQVAKAFRNLPAPLFPDDTTAQDGTGDQTFVDLYYAFITPPAVGRNLLGEAGYKDLMSRFKPGDQAIAIMANGLYSFKGVGYVRGGIFDRVHVVQGHKVILFHDSDFVDLSDTALAGMPSFREMGIFIIRKSYGFDLGRPWTLELLVRRQIGPLKSIYTTFDGTYQIPSAYVVSPAGQSEFAPGRDAPLWMRIWYQNRFQIAVLVAGLLLLSVILVFQDWFARHPRLLEGLRTSYLIYTAVFIGWYGLAQLSVVNILTFIHAVLHDFRWSTFLMDPLIFILWVFVAITLLLLGRGVYCGWLCPFGALQALINKAARCFRVPQYEFPRFVHERLWAVKYIILLGLFGLSLQSVNLAERFSEIEPFKTAIDLHFLRSWPFVLYAVGLLAVSALNNKFYCRYVCPLGAGLAVAGRQRMFDWLRRRPECGHPCHVCANECEVQAIDAAGHINHNECHHCLDCQITYWNDHKCPPLVQLRKRREKTGAAMAKPVAPHAKRLREPAATD
ncbi:MAG: NosR/NirI family protein [Alphaproteobacteria bacterium]|nr:NosR/NirI family protein [Alphaproteobacteria bacterium]MDE2494658.1 regulatory protein NosR [Alphaproteobacteria bacterium]